MVSVLDLEVSDPRSIFVVDLYIILTSLYDDSQSKYMTADSPLGPYLCVESAK